MFSISERLTKFSPDLPRFTPSIIINGSVLFCKEVKPLINIFWVDGLPPPLLVTCTPDALPCKTEPRLVEGIPARSVPFTEDITLVTAFLFVLP